MIESMFLLGESYLVSGKKNYKKEIAVQEKIWNTLLEMLQLDTFKQLQRSRFKLLKFIFVFMKKNVFDALRLNLSY